MPEPLGRALRRAQRDTLLAILETSFAAAAIALSVAGEPWWWLTALAAVGFVLGLIGALHSATRYGQLTHRVTCVRCPITVEEGL
jgi:hypothetical protein